MEEWNQQNWKGMAHLSLLKMHLKTQGAFYVRKAQFKKAGTLPTLGFVISQEAFIEASSRIAYQGARKISHTLRETWECKVMCPEITELLSGLDQKKTLEAVLLSNDVMCFKTDGIPFNILKQIIQETAASPFPMEAPPCFCSLHCGCAHTIKEFLLCESPLQTTKAVDFSEVVKRFFSK